MRTFRLLARSLVAVAATLALVVWTAAMLGAGTQELQQQQKTAWFCPMHPDVTADEKGSCRKCGMAMVAGHPFDTRDYLLTFTASPPAIVPGVPFTMQFRVRHPDSGAVVKDFEPVHEKKYHLFVVSHDMTVFQHLHPEQRPDGSWALEVTVPKPGHYRLLSDFLPTGGAPQFQGRTLVTARFAGDLQAEEARLQPDTVRRKTAGAIVADLTLDPPRLIAGQFGHLEYRLSDAATGAPITDLQPYLGAFGHTLIVSEDLADVVHSHPSEWLDGADVATGLGGPRVTFEGYMPRPGRYRAWTQFLRKGELTTVSFTFAVSTLDEAMRERFQF
jgi:hypothetical protein